MPNLSKTWEKSESLYLPTRNHARLLTRKKSGKLVIPLLVLLAISFFALPAQAKYGGGTGEPNDPYLIYDANQMNAIGADSNDWDKHFKLMADIDLSAYTGTSFNIIGASWLDAFTGVFDGNGFAISNFTYASTDTIYIALFAYVSGANAEIKNLGLIDPNVDAGSREYVGSLVGQLSGATITNCYVQGGSVSGAMNVGGLVGDNDGTITSSYATARVSGSTYVGGLVGYNGATITNCYADGGSVSGGDVVGGLVGLNEGWLREGTINNCYSTGSVTGGQFVSGLLGYNLQGDVNYSFWDIETSGQTTSDGGTPKTTAEMQMVSTFSAWACAPVWILDEGNDYPRLAWQNTPGETIAGGLLGGGRGTQADPYLIYTAEQLNTIALIPCDLDKHFKLMADIDLAGFAGTAFNLIGTESIPFAGVFDGNGHTISNFSYTSTEGDNIGLFGYVDGLNAEIKDLGLIAPDVDGGTGDRIGSLVGYMRDGTITTCYTEDGSVSGNYGGDSDYTFYPISAGLRDISTTGTRVILGLNQVSYGIPLPFNFNFYDTRLYQMFISSNGFITFLSGQDAGCCSGRPLPNTDPWNPHGLIAGFWNYLDPSIGGTIRYKTLGSVGSREFVIGFYEVPRYYSGYPVTFEIILHEGTNNIELQYGSAPSGWTTDSVGIENFDGTDGLQVAYGSVSFDNEGFLIVAFAGSKNVGALVGRNEGTITDSYSTSDVSGIETVGGLVGGNSRLIFNSYSTGSVSGDYRVGGLVGDNDAGEVTGCFWDIETSGQTTSAGGTGKTTDQMQDPNTFMDVGWDFVGKPDGPSDIWAEPAGGGYPILWWQLSPVPALPTFSGGTGEPNDPYLISTAAELNSIGHNPRLMKAHFKVINDIDLTGVDFYIIGSRGHPYTGVFDGNGHAISNFTYTSWGANNIGLFGYVKGVIKDLGLLDPDVNARGGDYVGSLVGWLNSGTVTNCYADRGSVVASYNVGGLVGYSYRATITNSYATAGVSGSVYVGGLMGRNYGTITDCYSTGSVSGSSYVGGLVGWNDGTITKSYATTSIERGSAGVGGLVGWNYGTVTNCYAEGDVPGYYYVGGLAGWNDGIITSCYSIGNTSGYYYIGGLVGINYYGTLSNCYSTGDVSGTEGVGGLVGYNMSVASVFLDHTFSPIQNNLRNIGTTGTPVTLSDDEVSGAIPLPFNFNFYDTDFSEVFISSNGFITFLSGWDHGCCQGDPLPTPWTPNGLIAGFWSDLWPPGGIICYQTLGFEGSREFVIGFYGVPHCCSPGYYPVTFEIILHEGTNNIELQYGSATSPGYYTSVGIENFDGTDGLQMVYSWDVSFSYEGFLITIDGLPETTGGVSRCYSTGSVSGDAAVGGLLGFNEGTASASFWDTETSGQPASAGGTGLPTARMQDPNTFTDARWDFTTPVWAIDEGVDYPHLWWEIVPVMHTEPEITLGTGNTITWDPVLGAVEYYAECAEDANFTSIAYSTGWITETSYKFTGLESGKHYWYSVKARNIAGVETYWSNVESSLQVTLDDAVELLLDIRDLKNRNMKNALLNKINALQKMIADGLYEEALDKLRNDLLQKTDGCALTGEPDKNDWIKTCEAQSLIYPLIIETIENVIALMEQSPDWLRTPTSSSSDTRSVTVPLNRRSLR